MSESTGPAPEGKVPEKGLARDQARRYLEAVYGKAVWYRSPEIIPNFLERWVWAVASGAEGTVGESSMSEIERLARGEGG